MLGQILGFLLLLCALGLFLWALINYTGTRLLPSIAAMTRASNHIRDGDLRDTITDLNKPPHIDDDGDTCVELKYLRASFQAFISSLRIANPTYAGASQALIMDTYEQAIIMYTSREDREGLLHCHTEMANYALQRGDMPGAWDALGSAADKAAELEALSQQQGNKEEAIRWQNVHAMRLATKALLYGVKAEKATSQEQQNACLHEKESMLLQALEMDRETDNCVSFALHAGYLGQLYLQTQRKDDAGKIFAESSNASPLIIIMISFITLIRCSLLICLCDY
jgi:hypothetical protein